VLETAGNTPATELGTPSHLDPDVLPVIYRKTPFFDTDGTRHSKAVVVLASTAAHPREP